jgi:hypothetical protein
MNMEDIYNEIERQDFHGDYPHWVYVTTCECGPGEDEDEDDDNGQRTWDSGYKEQDLKQTGYYHVGGIEVIDYIQAKLTPEQFKGYLLGNIYKYSGRCQYKGEYEKDVVKLAQYVNWLLKC